MGHANVDKALLRSGMIRVGDRDREPIAKDRRRVVERDPVFSQITVGLVGVPLEFERHSRTVHRCRFCVHGKRGREQARETVLSGPSADDLPVLRFLPMTSPNTWTTSSIMAPGNGAVARPSWLTLVV